MEARTALEQAEELRRVLEELGVTALGFRAVLSEGEDNAVRLERAFGWHRRGDTPDGRWRSGGGDSAVRPFLRSAPRGAGTPLTPQEFGRTIRRALCERHPQHAASGACASAR